jgi:hypothetical protein
MLSGVLHSKRAVQMNIQIIRAFIQLKKTLLTNSDLRRKIEEMEKKYDKQFKVVFEAFRKMFELPKKERRITGFNPDAGP